MAEPVVTLSRQMSDACFADANWTAEFAGSSGQAVALTTALALGGLWGAGRAETDPRTRRRLVL
jgi:hypothetical protein